MSTRMRADQLLVSRGLFESRAKAQAAIEAGLVFAGGQRVRKASQAIDEGMEVEAQAAHPYVSRAGLKLAAALKHFRFKSSGKICLDIGASTGGFTEVLLNGGARKIYAVDVGTDQLHASLRKRKEVVSFEKTDIRNLARDRIPEAPSLIVIDVSFISLKQVLPKASELAAPKAEMILLIKPQFEAGKKFLKKGIVRDAAVHRAVCEDILMVVASLGWEERGIIQSPISGGDGNTEFLLGARRSDAAR